jgi:hypothetical protein
VSIGDFLKGDSYSIISILGKGIQGVVFLVEALKTNEKYLNS